MLKDLLSPEWKIERKHIHKNIYLRYWITPEEYDEIKKLIKE